ncbi:MAG: hypothetical protein SOW24_00735, partial [Eubacteriales bacterium]|nr:hypothetical protein [Eubacteriales bacterium]
REPYYAVFLRKWQFLPSGTNWRVPGSILFEEWTFKVAIHRLFPVRRVCLTVWTKADKILSGITFYSRSQQ